MNSDKDYEVARQLLLQGKVAQSFDLLKQHGLIIQESRTGIAGALGEHSFFTFVPTSAHEPSYTTTVLCPDDDHCAEVTGYIRQNSKNMPQFSQFGDVHIVPKIQNLNLTNEEKVRCNYGSPFVPSLIIDVHESLHGLTKGHSYGVRGVDRAGNVRLDNGAFLPRNMPDTFTVNARNERGFELCTGELVRVSHDAPTVAPNINPRITYRVVDIRKGSVFLKEAWPTDSPTEASAPKYNNETFALPVTYGRFEYAYCQKPQTPFERNYDYIYSCHDTKAAVFVAKQFRTAVLCAGKMSLTVTNDWKVLREELIHATHEHANRTRHVVETEAQERERTSVAKSVSLPIKRGDKGGFDHGL